jgi:hypothetical protein
MVTLSEIQQQADLLSREDRNGLLTYLLHGLEEFPQGIDDMEVLRREAEFDSGIAQELTQNEFLKQVGRGRP